MRRILAIGHNELRLFLKEPSSIIWLVLMPLAFVYFGSFAARAPDSPANRVPPVLIETLDRGFLGRMFIEEMASHGLRQVDPSKRETAQRGLRIPADFTERILSGKGAKIAFFTVEGSSSADAALIEARLVRALVSFNSDLLETLTGPDAPASLTEEALRAVRNRPELVTMASSFGGRRPQPTGFNFSLPSNLVLFLMMNLLIFGGTTLAAQRREGVLRRIRTTPVRRIELISGIIYGIFLLGCLQIVGMLVFGKFLFHVTLGANLPGVILVLLVFTWAAASLGVLVGSLINAEERIIGVCVLSSMMMAAIGGCWWPIEIAPPFAQRLALFVPTGWAVAGLHRLISFGSDISAIVPHVLVLAAFGLVATVAAVRWFRV
jgi:ABC-type multidrug transport system permease subunit